MVKRRFGSEVCTSTSQGEDRRLAVLSSFEASDLTFSRGFVDELEVIIFGGSWVL